jgi:hypothetical protein
MRFYLIAICENKMRTDRNTDDTTTINSILQDVIAECNMKMEIFCQYTEDIIKQNTQVINETIETYLQNTDKQRNNTADMILGAATKLAVTDAKGIVFENAHYALIEANSIIPSHIPYMGMGTLSLNKKYPENLQERRYHKDIHEADKVRRGSTFLSPAMLINSNPDAINGPPVCDKNGIVLGGNGRAMMQQLRYNKDNIVKDYLQNVCELSCFGLNYNDVERMDKPILVRVLFDLDATTDIQKAKLFMRILNESFTQGMDYATETVALSKKLTKAQWEKIGDWLEKKKDENETLNTFLLSSKGSAFATFLQNDVPIFNSRNIAKYVNEDVKFTLQGRRFIEDLFFAYILKTPENIEAQSGIMTEVLKAVAPSIIVASIYKGWDITDNIVDAIKSLEEIEIERIRAAKQTPGGKKPEYVVIMRTMKGEDVAGSLLTQDMFQFQTKFASAIKDPMTSLILQILIIYGKKPTVLKELFRVFTIEAKAKGVKDTEDTTLDLLAHSGTGKETSQEEHRNIAMLALANTARLTQTDDKAEHPTGWRDITLLDMRQGG